MFRIFGLRSAFLSTRRKPRKRAARSCNPSVERVLLSTYIEPPETWNAQNPTLSFGSGIDTTINGSLTTYNEPAGTVFNHDTGHLDDNDQYTVDLNPTYQGNVSVTLSISGAPSISLADPAAYPPIPGLPTSGPGGTIEVNGYRADKTIPVLEGSNAIPMQGGTGTATFTIAEGVNDPISALGITIIAQGIYTQYINSSVNYTVTISPTVTQPLPDIALTSASLDGTAVDYNYQTTNNPGSFAIGVYESATQSFNASSDPFVTGQSIAANADAAGYGSLTLPQTYTYNPAKPYLLVVADPNNEIAESNEDNNIVVIDAPALTLNSAALTPNGQSVNVTYAISGNNLPSAATINFYWATGPNFSNILQTSNTPAPVLAAQNVGFYTATLSVAKLDRAARERNLYPGCRHLA